MHHLSAKAPLPQADTDSGTSRGNAADAAPGLAAMTAAAAAKKKQQKKKKKKSAQQEQEDHLDSMQMPQGFVTTITASPAAGPADARSA